MVDVTDNASGLPTPVLILLAALMCLSLFGLGQQAMVKKEGVLLDPWSVSFPTGEYYDGDRIGPHLAEAQRGLVHTLVELGFRKEANDRGPFGWDEVAAVPALFRRLGAESNWDAPGLGSSRGGVSYVKRSVFTHPAGGLMTRCRIHVLVTIHRVERQRLDVQIGYESEAVPWVLEDDLLLAESFAEHLERYMTGFE